MPLVRSWCRRFGVAAQDLDDVVQEVFFTVAARIGDLASAYQAVGQLGKALPHFEEALARCNEDPDPDHALTLTSSDTLAGAYLAADRLDEALPLFKEILAKRQDTLGPNYPVTLTSMTRLGTAYQYAGQLDKAVLLLEETLAKQQVKPGPDHPDTLVTMHNLGSAYRAAGQLDNALGIVGQALAKSQKKFGPEHRQTLLFLDSLATVYQEKGDFAEAERNLRQCLILRQQKQPDAWTTFATQSQLAASLLGQRKYVEAEPLLVRGYEGLKAPQAAIPPRDRKRLREAPERLVQLYDGRGKKNEADIWRKQLRTEPTAAPPT